MNIQISYEFPHNTWSVSNVFHGFNKYVVENIDGINFSSVNSSKFFDGNPSSYYSPHLMTIKNLDNGKYIVVSYWDNAQELEGERHGWDDENRVQLITSSGVHTDLEYTPFTYLCYSKIYDELSNSAKIMEDKENNNLQFRGFLYGDRLQLQKINKIKITNKKLFPEENYFNELTNNKICLSLNGAAEICNRDMEILCGRSVLLRPKLTQKFHNELIPNFHYVDFEHDKNPKIQSEIIIDKFNEISKDLEFLKFVSENGYEWYKNNGTVSSNISLLQKIVNLNKLI